MLSERDTRLPVDAITRYTSSGAAERTLPGQHQVLSQNEWYPLAWHSSFYNRELQMPAQAERSIGNRGQGP